jgi:hypothetical protein
VTITSDAVAGSRNTRRMRLGAGREKSGWRGVRAATQAVTDGNLEFDSAYDWDPDALPELAGLQHLVLNGVRRSTAAAIKSRFKGDLPESSGAQVRTRWPEWRDISDPTASHLARRGLNTGRNEPRWVL